MSIDDIRDNTLSKITHLFHYKVCLERTSQIRLISAGSSSMGQNMISAHFGLGNTKEIKSLVIRWPSGTTQTFENVKPNQVLIVKESD